MNVKNSSQQLAISIQPKPKGRRENRSLFRKLGAPISAFSKYSTVKIFNRESRMPLLNSILRPLRSLRSLRFKSLS